MTRGGWAQGPINIGGGGGGGGQQPPWRPSPGMPALNPNTVRAILIIVPVLIMLATGYYQVEPHELGVVQRLGRFVRTAEPGPHIKIPFGIEKVTKVPVQSQLKMEFGFRTVGTDRQSRFVRPEEALEEAKMLTGDLNVAMVEWIVQYRIRDAFKFLFHVRNPERTLRDMSEATMRQVVGDHSVDEVITIGREAIALLAKNELQKLCDQYGIGVEIQQLVLQDVNPPDPVKPAFNEVNQAIQEKERAINESWAEYNKAVPRAKGEAEQAVRSAEGYALERVNNAEGDAKRFAAVYEEYRKAPAVTRKRIYLETMGTLMPKLGRKLVLDEQTKGILPLLGLGETRSMGTESAR
jgi:modulator of FtsH protease HflK